MWVVLYIIYPHYQYYIDPDGTAYLTISKRYADGDFQRAINGYWSPWSCWLTALLIKVGLQPIPASVIINALGATGFLYISQSFFLRFYILQKMQWLLNITLAFFLVYAVFWQSFDDLWECFFLLGTLRLILAERFLEKPMLWVACGFIGALAYFAKAYSFPFFILNTICCTWVIAKAANKQWLKPAITAIAVMVLCSLPWIWALHDKYGIWTTSTAGTLNTSWYLVGHPIWKDGIKTLLPPPYPDSPYYWEDPWFVNGPTPHFWNSWKLFGMQIARVGYNCWKLLRSMAELSIVFPFIAFVAVRLLRRNDSSIELKVVSLSFMLFPLGYLLINYEGRYLWYMVPLSMVIACVAIMNSVAMLRTPAMRLSFVFGFLTRRNSSIALKVIFLLFLLFPLGYLFINYDGRYPWYMVPLIMVIACVVILNRIVKLLSPVMRLSLIAISFLVLPLWRLFDLYENGKREFELAQTIKQLRLKGGFTSNALQRSMSKVAYFSGIQYYPPVGETNMEDLVTGIRANGVRYCFVHLRRDKWDMLYFGWATAPEGAVKTLDLRPQHNLLIYQMW